VVEVGSIHLPLKAILGVGFLDVFKYLIQREVFLSYPTDYGINGLTKLVVLSVL
jgi:hypothetical protein